MASVAPELERLTAALADRYGIERELGQGGMAIVYLAQDLKHRRRVAVKVLRPELAVMLGAERFLREIETTANLRHPHILPLYDSGESGGFLFYVMPFVEGESLRDKLSRLKQLPVADAIQIAREVADALGYAHERGVIHRDIKPENVLLESGHAVVADFGIAKAVSGLDDGRLTQTGIAVGTPAYMSPEQALADAGLDGRSDLYSLGCVLFEMLTGEAPFAAPTPQRTLARRLTEPPPLVAALRADAGARVTEVVAQVLAIDPADRPQTAVVFGELLAAIDRAGAPSDPGHDGRAPAPNSAAPDEGFWVAVLPFKYAGGNSDIASLADGLSEEIVTGLSRFSYLKVIARGSTLRYADQTVDAGAAGKEIGARYVMVGSLRLAGSMLRVSVQLVDAGTGAHLWAESYDRSFRPEDVFLMQDDLVPRIVSTCADHFGVLARSISDAVRGKDAGRLSPYEALMRGFGYHHRLTPVEHAEARDVLERAVEQAPNNADCWAMLSWIYSHEHAHGFNPRPESLERALSAARRAVDLAPSNHLAHQALAVVLFFRKETVGCLSAAERALALNPLDGSNEAIFLITFTGDWERGCALIRRAMERNPHHPGWYWLVLGFNEYRQARYREAVDTVVKANAPEVFWTNMVLVAAHGQLGDLSAAGKALRNLLVQKADFAQSAAPLLRKWFEPPLADHFTEGLRKAGLEIAAGAPPDSAPVAIAVLPFSDLSSMKDQQYLCEGMAEEIMTALVRIDGIRVASRTSAFHAKADNADLRAIARLLSVNHVLDGSVRTAGTRLRATAQLTDIASGYQLWSERFDREATDVFAVQDEIAAGVVDAVKARLAPGPHAVKARPQVQNLEAYRSYLKGRHLRYAKEDPGGAIRAFEEALRLDPTHAPSWTGLAEALALAALFGAIPAREACTTARKALATAVGLEGETADSWHGEGWLGLIERRWPAMEAAWHRAIELRPNHALALGSFGISLCVCRKQEEGLRLLERAREVDPLASFPYMLTAFAMFFAGRPADAHRYAEDALSFEKEDASALMALAMAQVALGRVDEGIATAEHLAALTYRSPFHTGLLGWTLASAGRTNEARMLLDELRARPASANISEAWLLGALGEADQAFLVLERAEEAYQTYLCFYGLPTFDSLRGDPRFKTLLNRLGLSGTGP